MAAISPILVSGAVLVVAAALVVATYARPRVVRRPLLNRSEARVFRMLQGMRAEVFGHDATIFVQVAYGEFLRGRDRAAHGRINAKRADFVVADAAMEVICVLEYQGSGHCGSGRAAARSARRRDAVKRRALRAAGIPLVEIPARARREDIAAAARTRLGPA